MKVEIIRCDTCREASDAHPLPVGVELPPGWLIVTKPGLPTLARFASGGSIGGATLPPVWREERSSTDKTWHFCSEKCLASWASSRSEEGTT
ncbi:MAG TPA: hypothetical protein VF458_05530 [Ktedonobacteraceae bacterium]